ncbi:MAG: flippase-like domain-containing protein [Chloroflexi bacterium]|nr:flippase-like domain-containing protein [Chloroflexota bacterium]
MGRIEITVHDAAPPRKDWKQILPGLIVSAVSLGSVLWVADPQQVIAALRLADYRIVLLAFSLSLVWLLLRAVVWRVLLREQASFKNVFFTIAEGYLLNNLLPLRLGEVARSFLLSRKERLAFWQVFSSIVIERVLDLACAVGLLLVTLPFVVGADWAREAALGAGALVIAGLGVLYILARSREQALAVVTRLGQRWPWIERLAGKRLASLLVGLAVLTDGRRFLLATGWMFLDWAVAVLQYFVLLRAFFPEAAVLWAAFALGVAALGAAAPSSPGAIGVMELSLVGALAVFQIDQSRALAFALTIHFFSYLSSGIFGSLGLAQDGESLTGLYRQIRSLRTRVQDPEPG